MRSKAQSFLPGFNLKTVSISHGGDLAKGRRKSTRPVDPKQALHVVLRSSRAKGALSLLHPTNGERVQRFTLGLAKRLGVRIYRYANVGNHLHLLVKVPSKAAWQRFSRELSGGIAMMVTRAAKGRPRSFWDSLLFTRIVRFGRDFDGVARYVIKNLFEAAGVPVKKRGAEILFIHGDPFPASEIEF